MNKRSRGRPARAKSAKSKMSRNPEFVCGDNINISSSSESEIERNNDDDDYDPTVRSYIHHLKFLDLGHFLHSKLGRITCSYIKLIFGNKKQNKCL